MWDPNETLAANWARDDDVVSWRSLDTLRGLESTEPFARDALLEEEDSASDGSDGEELVETIERQGPFASHSQPTAGHLLRQRPLAPRPDDALVLRELPSTSEMVSIREPLPVPAHMRPLVSCNTNVLERPETGIGDWPEEDAFTSSFPTTVAAPRVDALQRSPGQMETRRVSMTLGDLLAKKKADTTSIPMPLPPLLPPPPPVSIASLPSADTNARLHDMQLLERRCEDMAEKDRHLQSVLAKQLHQIESMGDQMRQQDTKSQSQQLELSALREQLARAERQNETLQAVLREKELAQDQHTQLLVQKTNELSALETKVRSLQITNETLQEQARKATDEKDKTHKDYLQVVYDLGKLQKQMNAAAKETVNVAEKDMLLREIDQVRHEKDQLSAKLKESEARKASLLQNNAAVEAQKLRELQSRVRELEEDLQRARGSTNTRGMPSQRQPSNTSGSFPPPTAAPPMHRPQQQQQTLSTSFDTFQSATPHDCVRSSVAIAAPTYAQQDPRGMPSHLSGMQSGSNGTGTRPMTLKDMMGDRRPPPSSTTASSSTSLASMGFSSADRRTSGSLGGAFDFEQFKADALARRSTSIGDMLRQQEPPPSMSDLSFALPPNPALSAPFATEKQTLLQDSLQKRDLEQKLLKLHVEKEQMEAKLIKVEQTGLKTMSARTDKAWLESRLRDVTLEVSRLKLSLR